MKLLTLAICLGLMTYVLCNGSTPAKPSRPSIPTGPKSSKPPVTTAKPPGSTAKPSGSTAKPSGSTAKTPAPISPTKKPSNGGNTVLISSVWAVILSVTFVKYFSRF